MTSLFLVSSAIYTPYGKCSEQERIEQTKDTIKSIKTYVSDCDIILLDGGEKSVDIDFGVELINYNSKSIIQEPLQEYLNNNQDKEPDIIIKSMLEIIMFLDYFNFLYENSKHSNYSRIFKMSGRYKLNSKFDYSKHLRQENKVVILPPYTSQHLYNFSVSTSMMIYMTRCWSFDSNLLPEICKTYEKMKIDILKMMRSRRQGDIEHLLYRHLNKKLVSNIDTMGIEGYWAPMKLWIEE